MEKRWLWIQNISPAELRASVILLQVLAKAFDLRHRALLDLSDNEATVFSLAHGRSSSPQMNLVLVKRAALEAVVGCTMLCTWTSTLFMPMDLGTRLTDDDPLLGNIVAPLRVCCRLILVGGCGAQLLMQALKSKGYHAVIQPSSNVTLHWEFHMLLRVVALHPKYEIY